MATYQVRYDENGQKILSDPLSGLSSTIATSETLGAVQPDNVTTKVDSAGILSAIGGNLLMNDEIWITESGTWTAPVTGWYDVLVIGGGMGGSLSGTSTTIDAANGGSSGQIIKKIRYYEYGAQVDVSIGAGGVGSFIDSAAPDWDSRLGGDTIFDDITAKRGEAGRAEGASNPVYVGGYANRPTANITIGGFGGGLGGGSILTDSIHGQQASWFGAGGAAYCMVNKTLADFGQRGCNAGDGYQGAVRLRFWNPAKANGLSE